MQGIVQGRVIEFDLVTLESVMGVPGGLPFHVFYGEVTKSRYEAVMEQAGKKVGQQSTGEFRSSVARLLTISKLKIDGLILDWDSLVDELDGPLYLEFLHYILRKSCPNIRSLPVLVDKSLMLEMDLIANRFGKAPSSYFPQLNELEKFCLDGLVAYTGKVEEIRLEQKRVQAQGGR